MADITTLNTGKRRKTASKKARAQGKTLCARGYHKWEIDTATRFDVKQGKLVTLHRCQRCGERKTSLS